MSNLPQLSAGSIAMMCSANPGNTQPIVQVVNIKNLAQGKPGATEDRYRYVQRPRFSVVVRRRFVPFAPSSLHGLIFSPTLSLHIYVLHHNTSLFLCKSCCSIETRPPKRPPPSRVFPTLRCNFTPSHLSSFSYRW